MSNYPQPPTQDDSSPYEQPPKVWELHDPYQYAPPKTDGDSWHVVLEPLLKKDKMRCDAWKDEVQNLLIFAGLFSAVATAFVIESYKSLQADPVVGLLQVINASRSNSSTASIPPFSPTASSIRVNIFWFMSLVLSLTTVLVGIVSLQWLREHQSYPDLTPKQIFALFHMRSEGLKKWHVSQIFSALPLLLQAALVLFFAGMIDFLFSLQRNVAIPIVLIIGLTSIFLVATTVIPTLQGIPFYFPFLYFNNYPPSQCTYKSPQSQAFLTLSQFAFRGFSFLLPVLYTLPRRFRFQSARPGTKFEHYLIPSIASTWSQSTWVQFDLAWLAIRDAYMQGYCDRKPDLYLHRRKWKSELPLYDVVRGLREAVELERHSAVQTDRFLAAVHYCFEEVSLSIMDRNKSFNDPADGFGNQERRNRYFRWIVEGDEGHSNQARNRHNPVMTSSTLSDLLHLNKGWGLRGWEAWEVLHHENMLVFLSQVVLTRHASSILSTYVMELQMRMVRDLLGKPRETKGEWDTNDVHARGKSDIQIFIGQEAYPPKRLPPSLLIDYVGFKEALSKCRDLDTKAAFCYQFANIVKSFFLAVANSAIDLNRHDQPMDTFHTHRQMLALVTEAGWISSYVMNIFPKFVDGTESSEGRQDQRGNIPLTSFSANVAQHTIQVLVANFSFIAEQLEAEMQGIDTDAAVSNTPPSHPDVSTLNVADSRVRLEFPSSSFESLSYTYSEIGPSTEPIQSPSLLFYVACLYIKPFTQQHHEEQSPIRKALDGLKPIMRRYYYKRMMPLRHLNVALSSSRVFVGSNAALLDVGRMQEMRDAREGVRRLTALEDRWSGAEEYGVERFSEEWWRFILSDAPRQSGPT